MNNQKNIFSYAINLFFIVCLAMAVVYDKALAENCPKWNTEQAQIQFDKLNTRLKGANQMYRTTGKSDMTDSEYDFLKNKLQFWQTCFNFLANNVTGDTLPKGKVKHIAVHTGIKKAKTDDAIKLFIQNNTAIWLMPKIDGLAVTIIYKNGFLTQAITRGNGEQGQDITEKIKQLKNLPQKLNSNVNLVVQGELFWRHSNRIEKTTNISSKREAVFGYLMKTGLAFSEDLANCLENIDFFVWEAPSLNLSFAGKIDFLHKQGFKYIKTYTKPVSSFEQVKKLRNYFSTTPLPFATDGIVINANSIPDYKTWKVDKKTWSIAWKYDSKLHLATIKSITFNLGRTGKVTPLAEFEPIVISGKTYKYVSLGSLHKLRELNLQVGDIVQLKLAGGIIPTIKKVIWSENDFSTAIPDFSSYSYISCMTNTPMCREQFLARLVYLSKTLPINRIGKATWTLLLENNLIANLLSWQTLNRASFLQVKNLTQKNFALILTSFENSQKQPYTKLLYALGVPLNLAEIKRCETKFKLANNLRAWQKMTIENWQSCGISVKRAKKVSSYLYALQLSLNKQQ